MSFTAPPPPLLHVSLHMANYLDLLLLVSTGHLAADFNVYVSMAVLAEDLDIVVIGVMGASFYYSSKKHQ